MARRLGLLIAALACGAAAPGPQPLVAEQLVLAEWLHAENRTVCAPLAFAKVAPGGWSARRAEFSGGWAVAFDRPGMRSAFGVAGTGSLPEDRLPDEAHREALRAQWPHFRELPAVSGWAGYGVEGGEDFATMGPGDQGLAYVRAGGQHCLYNVWSKLGREHLESLLDSLRLIPRPR